MISVSRLRDSPFQVRHSQGGNNNVNSQWHNKVRSL